MAIPMRTPAASSPRPRAARRAAASLGTALSAALLLAACGGGGGGDAVTGPPPGNGNGNGNGVGSVPAALVGKWSLTSVGNTNYYDPSSGGWSSPSGNGDMWQFSADGTFAHAQLVQSSLYNCTSRVFYYDTGTVTVSGTRAVLHSNGATITSQDNCHAEWNYERAATGTSGGVDYVLGAEDGHATLTLQWTNGVQTFRQ